MSKVTISGNASGTGTLLIAAPNTNSDITLNLPTTMGTNNSSSVVTTDAAGNLGLVVAPSAWGSSYRAIDLQGGGSFFGAPGDANQVDLSANTYNDNTNFIYKATSFATLYRQNNGGHEWHTAPSGIAGAAITFTQAMTLDASGQLQLNTTTADGQFHVSAGTLSSTSGAEDLAASFSTNDGNNTRLQIKAYRFSAGSDHTTDELKIQRRVDSANQTYIGFRTDGRTDIGNGTTSYLTVTNGTTRLNGGIQFNGDTAAVNTLDDYEEGTFAPVISGATTAGTGTYTTQVGRYTKIGNIVTYSGRVVWTAHTGTGIMRLGLPFTLPNITSYFPTGGVNYQNLTVGAGLQLAITCNPNAAYATFDACNPANTTRTAVTIDTAADIMFTVTYEAV